MPPPNEIRRPSTGGALEKAKGKEHCKNTRPVRRPQAQGIDKATRELLARIADTPVVATHGTRGTVYSLPSGAPLSRHIVEHLIESRLLVPCDDGLFPGFAQTLRVRETAL